MAGSQDFDEPGSYVTLVQRGQCEMAMIDPVEKVQGDVERLSEAVGGSGAVAAALGASARAVQQMPLRIPTHHPGLGGCPRLQD